MAKRNRASADDVLKQLYPDIMTSDDYEEEAKKKAAAKQTDDTAATIKALQSKIDELTGQVAASRQNPVQQAKQETPPVPPTYNYENAPDPTVDPKGFAKFVQDNADKRIAYERDVILYNQRQSQTAQSKVGELWSNFSAQYGDYAKDQEKVRIAADNIARKAQAAGQDVEAYMYGNSSKFMKDVVGEIDRLWPKSAAGDDNDDDDTNGDDDDDFDTAQFVSPTARSDTRGKQRDYEPPQRYGALSQEILAFQEKTGFHR